LDFNLESHDAAYSDCLKKLFDRIGENLLEISFERVEMTWELFQGILVKTSDLLKLELDLCGFYGNSEELDFKCKNLKELVKRKSYCPAAFSKFIPDDLKQLTMDGNYTRHDEILNRQTALRSLTLEDYCLKNFEFSSGNCKIKELNLKVFDIPQEADLQQFTEFMKIQKSVSNFQFSFYIYKIDDSIEILLHILSLKSLRELTCGPQKEVLAKLEAAKLCNPALEKIEIDYDPECYPPDFKTYATLFPNIESLKLIFDVEVPNENDPMASPNVNSSLRDVDLSSISFLKNLKKLHLNYYNETILGQISLKNLREIVGDSHHVPEDSFPFYDSSDDEDGGFLGPEDHWRIFISENSTLESLELFNYWVTFDQLKDTLEGLPLLKKFKFNVNLTTEDEVEKSLKLIGKYYAGFESMRIHLNKGSTAGDYVKEHYPQLKFEISQYNWGLTIFK
jgi:hypothetical protein